MKNLTTAEAAQVLGIKKSTLDQWRYLKKGPQFRKFGKVVRYSEADLLSYQNQQTRTSTSHQGYQTY